MRCVTVVLVLAAVAAHTSAVSIANEKEPEKVVAASEEKEKQPHTSPVLGEPNVVTNEVPDRDATKVEVPAATTNGDEESKPVDNKNEEKDAIRQENIADKVTYEGAQLIRVAFKTKEQKKFVKELEANGELESWLGNGTAIDLMIHKSDTIKKLEDKQINYEVVIPDLQRAIEEENPQLSEDEWNELVGRKVPSYSLKGSYDGGGKLHPHSLKKRERWQCCNRFTYFSLRQIYKSKDKKRNKKRKKGHRLTWQMYHRMEDIHGYLDYLAVTYPQTVSVSTIGNSIEGRPLKLLKVSSGQPNSPGVWVDSGIHAREWITPASLTYVISQMVEGGDGAKGIDWYFLPIVNPDGYEHSHTRDRLWRKNRADPSKGTCAGIDLNRNFGYKWGGQGASRQPCRETYAGTGPFSEPETAAINNFITSHNSQIKAYVSLHSYGQYILYPWGYDRKVPPDYADLDRVGRLMATSIRSVGGMNYRVGAAANTLYPASGGSDDWAKGTAKIKYAYTIELRDTGRHGFVLPAQYIIPTAKDAYAALDALSKELVKPT